MTGREVIEQHRFMVFDEVSRTRVELAVTAVDLEGVGPGIEIGSFSMSCADAARIAESLVMLADMAEPDWREHEEVFDPVQWADRLRKAEEEEGETQ